MSTILYKEIDNLMFFPNHSFVYHGYKPLNFCKCEKTYDSVVLHKYNDCREKAITPLHKSELENEHDIFIVL